MFTDASSEDHRVGASKCSKICPEIFSGAIAEDIDGESRTRVILLLGCG